MRIAVLTALAGALTCGLAAGAESDSASPRSTDDTSSVRLEEIVVTAQKRAENAQDVPIAMNVLSSDELSAFSSNAVSNLELAVPGLVIGTVTAYSAPYLRGVGTNATTGDSESPIGTYLDGVYLAGVSNMALEFNDVQRVEVLKGPQGTLYGRNTTGGAINIITRDPTSTPEAKVTATYGNHAQKEFSGYLSGGTDLIAANISAFSKQHDGTVRNRFDGTKLSDRDIWGARGKIKVKPGDVWAVTFSADYSKEHDTQSTAESFLGFAYPTVLGAQVSNSPDYVYTNYNKPLDFEHWGVALTADANFANVNFFSQTSYREDKQFAMNDIDASSLLLQEIRASYNNDHYYSQEFRLSSPKDQSPLEWVAGVYFFKWKFEYPGIVLALPESAVPNELTITGGSSSEAYAAFGQATYALTDYLRLTVGARYNNEKKTLDYSHLLIPAFNLDASAPVEHKRWTNTSPKVNLQYHRDDTLLYADVSKGFKSGQYNLASPGSTGPVDPEKLTAYEVGGKHEFLDKRLRFNWSAFHYSIKDLQVQMINNDSAGVVSLQNAARAKTDGIDVDLQAAVTNDLQVSLGAEYLDSKYRDYPGAVGFQLDSGTGQWINQPFDAEGERTNRSPPLTVSSSVRYTMRAPGGSVGLTGSYYYNDGYYFSPINQGKQKSYSIANFRASYSLLDDKLEITAFVKNAFDKRYLTGLSEVAPWGRIALYNDPRMYGVTLSWAYP